MKRIDSYDPQAHTPALGSRWVWEIDTPCARALIKVTEVKWNGEEWWVRTRTLMPAPWPPVPAPLRDAKDAEHWNDLSRFAEAAAPVGAALPNTWVYRAVAAGTERTWTPHLSVCYCHPGCSACEVGEEPCPHGFSAANPPPRRKSIQTAPHDQES